MEQITNKELDNLLNQVTSYLDLIQGEDEVRFHVEDEYYIFKASFCLDENQVKDYSLSDENDMISLTEEQIKILHDFFTEKLEDKNYGDRQQSIMYKEMLNNVWDNTYLVK